jgi:hypothetical protein
VDVYVKLPLPLILLDKFAPYRLESRAILKRNYLRRVLNRISVVSGMCRETKRECQEG